MLNTLTQSNTLIVVHKFFFFFFLPGVLSEEQIRLKKMKKHHEEEAGRSSAVSAPSPAADVPPLAPEQQEMIEKLVAMQKQCNKRSFIDRRKVTVRNTCFSCCVLTFTILRRENCFYSLAALKYTHYRRSSDAYWILYTCPFFIFLSLPQYLSLAVTCPTCWLEIPVITVVFIIAPHVRLIPFSLLNMQTWEFLHFTFYCFGGSNPSWLVQMWLLIAVCWFLTPLPFSLQPWPQSQDPMNREVRQQRFAHFTELAIMSVQEIVDFAKQLPGFLELTREDQIALLKTSTIEVSKPSGHFEWFSYHIYVFHVMQTCTDGLMFCCWVCLCCASL